MTRTALVTGASGLLGREVLKAFDEAGWKAVGTALSRPKPPSIVKLDLLSADSIISVLDEVRPDVVVHCAANRFPDSCSSDPTGAAALNVQSTRSLAAQAQKRGIVLIYISTDYVFSGKQGEAPYKTDDRPSPPNIYGQTKYEGEMAVLSEMGLQAQRDGSQEAAAGASRTLGVSLRVPLLYGHVDEGDKSESAVHPLLHAVHKAAALKEGEPKVKADHYSLRYPTATEDVARVCVDVAKLYLEPGDKELPHILHFSAQDKYTKYEMCKLFGEILGLSIDNVEPDDPTKGMGAESSGSQRPYNTNLDVSALKKLGVDVSTANFEAWWRRELRAFRH